LASCSSSSSVTLLPSSQDKEGANSGDSCTGKIVPRGSKEALSTSERVALQLKAAMKRKLPALRHLAPGVEIPARTSVDNVRRKQASEVVRAGREPMRSPSRTEGAGEIKPGEENIPTRKKSTAGPSSQPEEETDDEIEILDVPTGRLPPREESSHPTDPKRRKQDKSPSTTHGEVSGDKTGKRFENLVAGKEGNNRLVREAEAGVFNVDGSAAERTAAVAEWVMTASMFRGDLAGTGIERPPDAACQEPRPSRPEVLALDEEPRQAAGTGISNSVERTSATACQEPRPPSCEVLALDEEPRQAAAAQAPSTDLREISASTGNQESSGPVENPGASICEPSGDPVASHVGEDGGEREEAGAAALEADVQSAVQAVIKSCEAFLPAAELQKVDKKLSKYVNSIAPQFQGSAGLGSYIVKRWALLDAKKKNVYLLLRDILDELRKVRGEGRGGTASELSDGQALQQQLPLDTDDGQQPHLSTNKQLEQRASIEKGQQQQQTSGDAVKKRAVLLSVARPEATGITRTAGDSQSGANPSEKNAAGPGGGKPEVPAPGGSKKDRTVSSQHIRKLEKALALCGKKIKELEATEVDLNNSEDDDTYLLEARLVIQSEDMPENFVVVSLSKNGPDHRRAGVRQNYDFNIGLKGSCSDVL